ncbi:hypothetical protein Clacol_007806 [Clathrus columnatus]|uniref:Cytochrome P450 n=1 Tax=Clathrus columnatus TaxID=1419009 RepID=A0AAV5AM92_9AGAM|nr:hypothetical protein Clacol_007806 [Clathrus columnatus]
MKFSIGSVIIDVVYAIDIEPENDPIIDTIHTALGGLSYALVPGLWLVDTFPILKNIPDWLPGIPFIDFSKKYIQATKAAAAIPFDIVKVKSPKSHVRLTDKNSTINQSRSSVDHSFVSTSLDRLNKFKHSLPEEEAVIKNVAATTYAAGASTSYTALLQAIIASIRYPETQKKMHEELDRVLGDRLPTLADHKDLPYVSAFCSEVLRWRPAAPLGVPHAALEDDAYGDYFIPKGSIVFANLWGILREGRYGLDTENFNPERFFQPGVPLATEQFGFGRRSSILHPRKTKTGLTYQFRIEL